MNTIIGGNFGFIRLTDQSVETPNSTKDGFAAPNGSCGIEATGNLTGNTIVIPDTQWPNGTSVPTQIVNGITVVGQDLPAAGFPNPTSTVPTITNVTDNGTNTTITLSESDVTDNAAEQVTFGLPPILSVANPQT